MANSSVGLPQLTQVDWISAQIALIDIRTQVFIHEQKISADDEWDHWDATSWHFLADLPWTYQYRLSSINARRATLSARGIEGVSQTRRR
jgi:predicted GNAT family N-acyltransferase